MIDRQAINNAIRMLDAALHSVDSDAPPVVAVVGAFSRGKSALLNALLDMSLLPVHPLPATAVPTRIVYADTPSARLFYANHEDSVTVEDARAISAYRTATDGLCEIRIGWPGDLLKGGLALLDTPGIGALTPHSPLPLYGRGGVPRDLDSPLPPAGEGPGARASDVAALLFVFAADPPLGEAELDFLREMAPTVPRIVLVQTKCDRLAESDLRQATTFNRAAIDATYPALKAIPIVAVSALTGAGIVSLRDMLAGWDMDQLRHERRDWQAKAIQSRLQSLTDALEVERTRLATVLSALAVARAACIADLELIHAGTLATLARFSEYALGNLSAAMYSADPVELTGGRGLTLANNELRRLRDQLTGEIERALIGSRRRLIERLTAADIGANTILDLPPLILPDPQVRTVAVRIRERRVFLPKQLDAGQTIKAYRTAVAHMADAYAAELLPATERYLTDYRTALIDCLC
ncbi:MAG: dynamin family protein [Aggregatilineales bacterium]